VKQPTTQASQPQSAQLDLANLKAGGFIKQRQKDLFTVRVRTPMGTLGADRLRVIAEAAERFGDGRVHLSIRQTPEIVGVSYERFDELVDLLAAHGMKPASCGPRVRAVSGCSGCTINPKGLVDTQRLGAEMDALFFGTPCPAKFKMTFSGCGNDCTRAKCADLGFLGMVRPYIDTAACTACGLCVATCLEGSLETGPDGVPLLDASTCTGCADCTRICPVSALTAEKTGFAVYAGGKHGRLPRVADHVADLLPEELVPDVIERTLAWYQEHGARGQRLGHVIEATGVQAYKEAVIPPAYRVGPGAQRQTGRMVR